MSNKKPNPMMTKWLATRPPTIRELAERFPPGSAIVVDGRTAYVVSYVEVADGPPGIKVSFINPAIDYHGANADKFFVCGDHLSLPTPTKGTQ